MRLEGADGVNGAEGVNAAEGLNSIGAGIQADRL